MNNDSTLMHRIAELEGENEALRVNVDRQYYRELVKAAIQKCDINLSLGQNYITFLKEAPEVAKLVCDFADAVLAEVKRREADE